MSDQIERVSSTAGQCPLQAHHPVNAYPKILTYLHSFEPGGVERVALRLCAEWSRLGMDCPVAMGRIDGPQRATAPDLRYLVAPRPFFSTAHFETLWMMGWLLRVIRREKPDLIFCPGNSYTIVAVVMKLLLRSACPPIVAKISNDLERTDIPQPVRGLYRTWCRVQGCLIDHFVGLAEPMRREIAEAMRIAFAKVSIINDPALSAKELSLLHAAGVKARNTRPSGRRFLAAGRCVAQKNFALLIEAFDEGSGRGDILIIVGDGPERSNLEKQIVKRGLQQRVVLAGHQQDMRRWFARSDIFLLSSDYEGVPAVVIEALACGMPVIATECSVSIRSLLAHQREESIVPVRNRTKLAAAIRAASLCQSSVIEGPAVAAQFCVARSGPQYLVLFRAILAEARKPKLQGSRNRPKLDSLHQLILNTPSATFSSAGPAGGDESAAPKELPV